jgi:hypothetical protein
MAQNELAHYFYGMWSAVRGVNNPRAQGYACLHIQTKLAILSEKFRWFEIRLNDDCATTIN